MRLSELISTTAIFLPARSLNSDAKLSGSPVCAYASHRAQGWRELFGIGPGSNKLERKA